MKIEGSLVKLIAIIIAVAIMLLITQPYFGILAFAALLAYLLHPLYQKLSKRIAEDGAAVLITGLALAIVVLTISYGINTILNEFARISLFISRMPIEALSPTVEDALRKFLANSISQLSSVVYALPQIMLSFLIFFISLFYLLRDGEVVTDWIQSIIPFAEEKRKTIFRNISKQADAFVHVQLVIGLVQAVVAAAGFYIFGLPYPIIAGLIAGILSILPVIGPYLLYVPVSIIAVIYGSPFAGIGILIYGLVIASILDYIVRPHLIGKKAHVHPLIIFIGIFGGLQLLGIAGIFIGPILLSVAIIIFKELTAEISIKT